MPWSRRRFEEWRTGLNAEEIGVVVIESGDVHVELRFYQAPIPDFVANQVFRRKLSVPNDAIKS